MSSSRLLSLALLAAIAFFLYQLLARDGWVPVPDAVTRAGADAAGEGTDSPLVLGAGSANASGARSQEGVTANLVGDPRRAVVNENAPCTLRCVLHPVEGGGVGDGGDDFAIIALSGKFKRDPDSTDLSKHRWTGQSAVFRAPRLGEFTIEGLKPGLWTVAVALRTHDGVPSTTMEPVEITVDEKSKTLELTPRYYRLQGSLQGLTLEDLADAESWYKVKYRVPLRDAAAFLGAKVEGPDPLLYSDHHSTTVIPIEFGPGESERSNALDLIAPYSLDATFAKAMSGMRLPLQHDRLGTFRVPVVGPCEVKVSVDAMPDRWLRGFRVAELTESDPIQALVLELRTPSSLLLDPKIASDGSASVSARLELVPGAAYRFDGAGPYEVQDLIPAPYDYWLEIDGDSPSIAWGTVSIEPKAQARPDFVLRPRAPAAVKGKLVYANGRPLMFVQVNLHLGSHLSYYAACKTGRRGEFELEAPSSGTFSLTASGAFLKNGRLSFTVPEPVGDSTAARPAIDVGELVARRGGGRGR